MTKPKAAVTAGDIRAAMLKKWPKQEWAIMWEVAPATGVVAGKVRFADAVMMSLWPSRGLDLHGVEIKVSRSDWRREAADPTKAERIAEYCDFWWVHVAPGVIQDMSEVPAAWGVRVFDGQKWKTVREARRTPAKACDRGFLAALLRRSDESQRADMSETVERMIQADREAYEARVKNEVTQRMQGNDHAIRTIEAFEAASGLTMEQFKFLSDAKEIGAIVKAIRAVGLQRAWGSVSSLRSMAATLARDIDTAMAESGLPYEKPPEPKRGRA